MAIAAGEQQTGGEVRDNDGRLIVVGPGGVAIGGGGGTVDITDRAGRLLGHVTVDNFPGTQPVSGPLTDAQLRALAVAVSGTVTGNQGTPNTAANGWPAKVTDGTNTAQVLNAAPGSDTGQSALAVRVVSQLGAGSGGGAGTQFAEDAALGATPTGTLAMARRTDTLATLTPVVDDAISQRVNSRGALWVVHDGSISVANFPATQAVSGTVTANAGTGPFPVSDNAGSLTVDAPVGTPLFARLSDGAAAYKTNTDAQLPAALVGGRLDVNLGATIAVPVTDNGGSLTVDAPVGTPLRVDPTGTTTQPVSLAAVPTVTEKQDQPASTTATWTSATALNTALTNSTVAGYGTATVTIQTPSTATAGVITIEVSDDGTVWYPSGAVRVDNGLQENTVALAGPGVAQSRMYAVSVDAMTGIRARLSTAIVGTGNTIVRIGLIAGGIEPFISFVPQRTPVSIYIDSSTGLTVEALSAVLNIQRGDAAAVTAQTTYSPTAGKTFRLLSATFTGHANAAALVAVKVRIRTLNAGTVTVTSPVRYHAALRVPAATAAAGTALTPLWVTSDVGGLLDVPPGGSLGISHVAGANTYILDAVLQGYEF